jgi:hypothetical protein
VEEGAVDEVEERRKDGKRREDRRVTAVSGECDREG